MKTKVVLDRKGDFRMVPMSEDEEKRREKHLKDIETKRANQKPEDQSARLAANWFRD